MTQVETLEQRENIAGDALDPQLAKEVEALFECTDDSLEVEQVLTEVRDTTGHWYVTMPVPGVRYYSF